MSLNRPYYHEQELVEHWRRLAPQTEISRAQQHEYEHLTPSEFSLDEAHPPEQEVEYLLAKRLLTPEAPEYHSPELQRHYLRENMITFLTEHAGKIPIRTLSGFMHEDGRMEILRTDIIGMAERAYSTRIQTLQQQYGGMIPSHIAQEVREKYELEGLKKVGSALRGADTRADVVSPPKGADYHMVFSFERGAYQPDLKGWPLYEYVFTIPDEPDSLEKSSQTARLIASRYGKHSQNSTSWKEYLSQPITGATRSSTDLLDTAAHLGYTEEDIQYSKDYDSRLRSVLSGRVEQYVAALEEAAALRIQNNPELQSLYSKTINKIKTLRDQMFSIGLRLRTEMTTPATTEAVTLEDLGRMSDSDPLYMAYMTQLSAQYRPVLTGTQCAAASMSGSAQTFESAFAQGISFFDASAGMVQATRAVERDGVHEACVRCPYKGCGNKEKNRKIVKGGEIVGYICGSAKCPSHKKAKAA